MHSVCGEPFSAVQVIYRGFIQLTEILWKMPDEQKKYIFSFRFVFCLAGFGIVSINRFRYVFRRSKIIHVYINLFGFVRKYTIYTQFLQMPKVNC